MPPDRLTAVSAGAAKPVESFVFHPVPASHETLETDENRDYRHMGLVVEAGPWTIYHSGDTILYPGMAERLARWRIDVALLPINGRDPARGVAGNLSAEEAAQLGKDIRAGIVIPCHFDMFEFNTVSPARFTEAAERIGQHYWLLRNGERLSLPLGEED